MVRQAERIVIGFCLAVAWFSLVGLCVAVFVGVLDRFLFKSGFAWPEAVGRSLLIWVALAGAVVAASRRAHFSAGFFGAGRFARFREMGVRIASALILFFLAWSAYDVMEVVSGQEIAGLEISITWLYAPLPLAAMLMGVLSLMRGISGAEMGA